MYWLHVARKDFADAVRSRMFWGLSVLMVLAAYIGLFAHNALTDDAEATGGIAFLSGPMLIVVPIIALIVGYLAIVGERESGSIRMVLSLPLRRGEVVFGKFVGRAGVVIIPVILGFGLAIPFVIFLYGEFPTRYYAEFVTRTVLAGLVYVSIAVGISASVNTRGKAIVAALGIFALFEWFWAIVPLGLYFLLHGEFPATDEMPTWVDFIFDIAPAEAVREVTGWLYTMELSTSEPLLVQGWVAGIIVLLWIGIPLGVGYLRFTRANIS